MYDNSHVAGPELFAFIAADISGQYDSLMFLEHPLIPLLAKTLNVLLRIGTLPDFFPQPTQLQDASLAGLLLMREKFSGGFLHFLGDLRLQRFFRSLPFLLDHGCGVVFGPVEFVLCHQTCPLYILHQPSCGPES